jgi:ribosome maturation factor RimP
VKRQYVKHTGRMVEVKFTDGRLLTGQLVAANDQGIQLRIEHPSKIKGRAPKLDEEATAFAFAEITSTQAIIKFN